MGILKLASVVPVLVAGQAFGASLVEFKAGLQCASGSYAQYVSDWKGGTPSLFPAGNQSDGQTFGANDVLVWDVTLTASGVQQNGAGAGQPIKGVANFVFDIELHAGTAGGPLVAAANFQSNVNDGTGSDPTASAAFAASCNLFNLGPGRVIDGLGGAPKGGPKMVVNTLPTNDGTGRLLGMGAGYQEWRRTGGVGNITSAGVGMTTIPNGGGDGFGIVPLAEGQFGGSLLPGTYTLVVKPADGTNVLRGDIDLSQNQNSFAVAADSTAGDSISFTVVAGSNCGTPTPSIVSASSLRTHGAAGQFGIDLPLAGTAAVEPRAAGSTPAVRFTFDQAPGALDCGDFTITNGSCLAVNVNGNDATVGLTGLVKNTCLTVAVTGIAVNGDNDVSADLIEGDVGSNRIVNILDLTAVKNALLAPVGAGNFRNDVNVNGTINILDLTAVKNNLLANAKCPQ